jgi:hypothetical protein
LAYSCKTRGTCPSCSKKRQVAFSRFLADEVLEPVPHRQVVFTVPKRVRPFFFSKRKRLARLARAAFLTVRKALRKACALPDGQPGAVAAIQTFGSLLDPHPHVHLLTTWGVFDSDGQFHEPILGSEASSEKLHFDFRERVFDLLVKDEAIDPDVVENMRSWSHSGFGTFVGPTVEVREDREGRAIVPEALLSYFVRAPIALTRIELTSDGKVLYKADRYHPKHNAKFRIFDPLEFLAHLALHIPDPNDRLVAFSGWYSNRSRGLRLKNRPPLKEDVSGLGPPLGPTPKPPRRDRNTSARQQWARLIQFVYEVDPLICQKCGGEMRIVACINEIRVIVKILDHLETRAGPGPPHSRRHESPIHDLIREPCFDDPWKSPEGDDLRYEHLD